MVDMFKEPHKPDIGKEFYMLNSLIRLNLNWWEEIVGEPFGSVLASD